MDRDDVLSGLILELRRGTIVVCALSQLNEPVYGYNLVATLSQSGVKVEANTLYPLLRRLESQGILSSSWETSGAKPRKYYVMTEEGKKIYGVLIRQWDAMSESVNKLLEGVNYDDKQ